MTSPKIMTELGIALQAQSHLLSQIDTGTSELESKFPEIEREISKNSAISEDIRSLELILNEIETSLDFLEIEDFADFDSGRIPDLYQRKKQLVFSHLSKIGFTDWENFVRHCQGYALSQKIDLLEPYESLLTDKDFQELQASTHAAQYKWDRWDYTFVGVSGVLASLTDYFLVKIPTTLKSGVYAGQAGSSITEWMKKYDISKEHDWFAQWAKHLEKNCKVPYDSMNFTKAGHAERIAGMYPRSHRLQSLGHDPVLGFVFGVLDIMRGTIHGFSYDKLTHNHLWLQEAAWTEVETVGLIEAMLRQIGHLLSDVATPMGLPAPFLTLIQGINVEGFGKEGRTIGEIARWMYLNGYDFRHFLVSGITPAVIEIVLRAYMMLRHYSEYGEAKWDFASHPKYRTMLLAAHGIATLGNVGKIVLMQGNPLAINYSEWIAFTRYLVPSLKYWIFDQNRLSLERWEKINAEEWDRLLNNSDDILANVACLDRQMFVLGANF